jgi:aerobic carbon-monoxide dehydrogenase small subunit
MRITLRINGAERTAEVAEHRLLVDFLRDELGLAGAKVGCGYGVCGSCSVIMNGEAIKSCLTLAAQADGAELRTAEGVAGSELHPVQRAFMDEGGFQCGYCTPGFIMSALALLEKNPAPSEAEIRAGLAGNLCRCTGYVGIVKAVQTAARRMAGKE